MHCLRPIITNNTYQCSANQTMLPFQKNVFSSAYHLIPTLTITWLTFSYTIIIRTIYDHLTLRGPRFTLLVILAFFDFSFCFFQCSFFYVNFFMRYSKPSMVVFRTLTFLLHTSFLNSTVMTMLITVNQFISVKYAIKYQQIVTNKRLHGVITIAITTSYILYFILYMTGYILHMFAIYLSIIFIVMFALMSFIYHCANTAIKAISKTESQISDAIEHEKAGADFCTFQIQHTQSQQTTKKKFSRRDNRREELLEKKNQLVTSQQLACISVLTMGIICTMAVMCFQSMSSGVQYTDIKVFMVICSLYVVINPVIYIMTMSKIRFFIRKDFRDWRENHAIRSISFRRHRRIAPSSI